MRGFTGRTLPILITLLLVPMACVLLPKLIQIAGSSMEPSYPEGTKMTIAPIDPADLERGDLVYLELRESDRFFVKRLIGLPGETVELRSGSVFIDGVLLEEAYDVIPSPYDSDVQSLGEDQYYVLGDNRPLSADSHVWGPIEGSSISGRAIPLD